jgi:catechol 2,3-dioxygenase-like lactoylglutathione lyase family enzyme
MMPAFNHVGLTVKNIERSYAFYHELVGMSEWKWEEDQQAEYASAERVSLQDGTQIISSKSEAFDRLTNNPGAEFKTVMLRSLDAHDRLVLQLVEYTAGGSGELELGHARAGSMHLSFYVRDVEEKRRQVESFGTAKILSEIVYILPTMRSFYVADPDGVPVEFLQVIK